MYYLKCTACKGATTYTYDVMMAAKLGGRVVVLMYYLKSVNELRHIQGKQTISANV